MQLNELHSAVEEGKFLRNLYGDDDAVVAQQKVRYTTMLDEFSKKFGHKEASLFSSPGRTEISGNHTDHNYGLVMAGSVNMDNAAVAAANGSMTVNISSTGYPQFSVDLSKLDPDKAEYNTSVGLVRGICARLKELGFAIGGFDAVINSGVPMGSGLSSSASFEVLVGAIVSHLFNGGKLDSVVNAQVGQYAENVYFGKPCGLLDQMACAVGGLITIDFADPKKPDMRKVAFDFTKTGYALVITDTGGSHANLSHEYAAVPPEMKSIAAELGKTVLREVSLRQVVDAIPSLREKRVSDRAILRAIHFERENDRVRQQVADLEKGDFQAFMRNVIASGQSSFMYCQNVYPASSPADQGVSIGLALSDIVLNGRGAWRVHGGGFAGTIQAYVPTDLLDKYVETLEHAFGKGKCHKLFIRPQGAIKVEI